MTAAARLPDQPSDPLSLTLAALADPVRRDLVVRLCDGDATVGELAAPYPISLQAVSKHLRVLEDAGVVTRSRAGRHRSVHLEAQVFDLLGRWVERYRREAEARYQRLDALLRELPGSPDRTTRTTPDRTTRTTP